MRFSFFSKKLIFSALSTFFILVPCASRPTITQKIDLSDSFYYWVSTAESTPGDAMRNAGNFKKLEDKTTRNLENTIGKSAHYVWLRAEFTIPPEFLGKPLGLVIPYLRFAEMLWCNGNFVSMFGSFPPHEQSTLYKSHFFNLPVNILDQNGGKNTLLIKVYSHGQSAISSHSFIQPSQYSFAVHENINFWHSKVYMLLEGSLVMTAILYLLLYISLKSSKREYRANLDYAGMNFFSIFFIMPFFANEIPFYTTSVIPYILFMKLTLGIPLYCVFFLISSFIKSFEHIKYPQPVQIVRYSILSVQIIITLAMPDYDALMKITVPMLILCMTNLGFGVSTFFKNLFDSDRRRLALIQLGGFSPVLICIVIDGVLRIMDNTEPWPFITIFGWHISIVAFLIILSIRFAGTYKMNEKLSKNLQSEVDKQTKELKDANYELSLLNEKLEFTNMRAETDLEMASIVQKKFFPAQYAVFKGWETSICYEPLNKVSGDLYDYYPFKNILNGISLFDVSGHGISASLITMLSKNIISRIFQKGFREHENIGKMLIDINDSINKEKGNIENYLTGLLFRFNEFQDDDSCLVEIGNAGHPYPYLYSTEKQQLIELKPDDKSEHCGAIGMRGMKVSFPEIDFTIKPDDIIVCFTDGLNESVNELHEQFGRKRIEKIILENKDNSAEEIMVALRDSLEKFCGETPRDDDLSIIVLKRRDSSAKFTPLRSLEEEKITDDDIEELELEDEK